jgi:hypothetical protein
MNASKCSETCELIRFPFSLMMGMSMIIQHRCIKWVYYSDTQCTQLMSRDIFEKTDVSQKKLFMIDN